MTKHFEGLQEKQAQYIRALAMSEQQTNLKNGLDDFN